MKYLRLRYLFSILFILGLIFYFSFTVAVDFDLGFHLRYGEYVLQEKKIPNADFLTYTYFGQPRVAPEWLFEVLTFVAFQKFSFWGLTIFSTIVGFTSFYFLIRLFSNPVFKILVILLAGFISEPILIEGLRPQLMTVLGTVFLISLFIKLDAGNKKYILFLPLLFILWISTHPGFLIGLVLVGFYILDWLFRVPVKNRGKLFISSIILFSAVIFFLKGLNFYSFPLPITHLHPLSILKLVSDIFFPPGLLETDTGIKLSRATILEWLPPVFSSYPGLTYLIFVLIVGITFIFWLKKFSLWQILTIILFSYMAGISRRHMALFAFSAVPITLLVIEKNLKLDKLPRIGPKVILFSLLVGLAILGVNIYQRGTQIVEATRSVESYSRLRSMPYLAVEYLQANPPKGNMFNFYNWGGYLDWWFPQQKVFIDGRMPGGKIYADYIKIVNVDEGWYETLESYNVSWIIMPTPFKLVKALVDEKDWQKVYEDSIATIIVRPPPE